MANYLAIGDGELDANEDISEGDTYPCRVCKTNCIVRSGLNANGKKSNLLLFITCENCSESYLIGIRGKCIFSGDR